LKAVILAGGLGTRLSEETDSLPKPMIKIGGKPIIWHIMKIYSTYGINDFIICCGYKGYVIKEYFSNYFLHTSDITIDTVKNKIHVHKKRSEAWKVTLIDTGENTMTGGRLKRIHEYIKNDKSFCFTYGDGVGNIDIGKLLDYHKQQKTLATVTAVSPPGRYGELNLDHDKVKNFSEKPTDGGYINGGFFVLSPKVIDLIENDLTTWEKSPLETLSQQGEVSAFKHTGFWQSMDTLRDKKYLEELWVSGVAPWKIW